MASYQSILNLAKFSIRMIMISDHELRSPSVASHSPSGCDHSCGFEPMTSRARRAAVMPSQHLLATTITM
eukprot:SAG11_NODE_1023_length_6154_cov_3.841288_1_plen_70_part_00